MKEKITWYQWLMTSAVMLLTICKNFWTLIKSPDTTLLSAGGDGLKNYLTPMLHVKNSSTYNHFDSMNYPYGEHVLFTDNQPLISNILRFFQVNFRDISYHTVGVLNYALLISLFLSACLLYYFFRRMELPHWYSLISSVIISWLSPQLMRFGCHYALGYMAILLLLLYFLMKFEKRESKWSYRITLLLFLAPLLHFYYFGISAFFISIFYLLKVIKDRKLGLFYLKHWSIQLLLPYLFFNFIWLKIGTDVTDRPNNPWGFLHYVSDLNGTFLKEGNYLFNFLNQYAFKVVPQREFESLNYVGFIATFYLFVRLVSWIFSRDFKVTEENLPEKSFFHTAFWASLILYIFSMGVPFIYGKLEFLLAYTGPLKQFRGLGRFSWMFYFVVNILGFYCVYHWGKNIKSIEFRRLFWVIFIAIGIIEARQNAEKISKTSNLYSILTSTGESIDDWLLYMDRSKYQAILPFPYFHLGAEYIGLEAGYPSPAYDLLASYYSGLPTMGSMMSRTSWKQAISSVPLGLDLYREPAVLRNLPDQRPLLVLENKEWHKAIDWRYNAILTKATKIHENNGFVLYELPVSAYQTLIEEKSIAIKNEAENIKLHQVGSLFCKDSLRNFLFLNFDENADPIKYRGAGSLAFSTKERKVLYKGSIPYVQVGKKYTFQFWLNIEKGEHASTELFIRELDKQATQKFFWHHGGQHFIKAIDGNWALVSFDFEPQFDYTEFEFVLENKDNKQSTLHIDEFMVYPVNAEIFMKSSDEVMKNGRWYPVK
ncbi:MAG: hypothetical protein ACOYOA_02735 [Saprospiraceae bacterium]